MRYATVVADDHQTVAAEVDGRLYRLKQPSGVTLTSVTDLLTSGAIDSAVPDTDAPFDEEVRLLAPFPVPHRNIICLGKNYASHAVELGGLDGDPNVPDHPIVFTKAPTTVTGPNDAIAVDPSVTQELDYEVELGVVIGRGGRFISAEEALDHVAGYVVINDLTARDLQRRHSQFFLGKSVDGSCPMGPVFVTADELGKQNLDLGLSVDGEERQRGNTRDLIFDIPTIIETISAVMTLQLGDIIATGTPGGVGLGFDPPRYLTDGSLVEAWVDGIGMLRNRISFQDLDTQGRAAAQTSVQPHHRPGDTSRG